MISPRALTPGPVMIAALLASSLFGCGEDEAAPPTPPPPKVLKAGEGNDAPTPISIAFTSTPPGATIRDAAGAIVGTTPHMTILTLRPEERRRPLRYELSLDGHVTQAVEGLPTGSSLSLTASLAPSIAAPSEARDPLLGDYRCTFEPYPPMRCSISRRPDGSLWLEKHDGSQRIRGTLVEREQGVRSYAFQGTFFCPWGACTQRVSCNFLETGPGAFSCRMRTSHDTITVRLARSP